MNPRDLATVAFRALAAWLFVTGVAALSSGLVTWAQNEAQYGKEVAIWNLAASALYIPIGALAWLVSDWAARRSFPASPTSATALDRSDLYAFASVLVGLYLLADALPQIVYWAVLWRSARGTGFWRVAADRVDDGVVFSVHAKAQVAATAAKTVFGFVLLSGPVRIKAGLLRVRRELSSSLSEPEVRPATPYLMNAPHWRVAHVKNFPALFSALHLVAPTTGLLALAAGTWPETMRRSLDPISIDPSASTRQRLPSEFRQAIFIPMGEAQMATLAALAERYAEPEIAVHIAAFTDTGSLVEWFDVATDALAVSSSVPPDAVSRFAQELGTTPEWVAGDD